METIINHMYFGGIIVKLKIVGATALILVVLSMGIVSNVHAKKTMPPKSLQGSWYQKMSDGTVIRTTFTDHSYAVRTGTVSNHHGEYQFKPNKLDEISYSNTSPKDSFHFGLKKKGGYYRLYSNQLGGKASGATNMSKPAMKHGYRVLLSKDLEGHQHEESWASLANAMKYNTNDY